MRGYFGEVAGVFDVHAGETYDHRLHFDEDLL
jgi:hypothetical protein